MAMMDIFKGLMGGKGSAADSADGLASLRIKELKEEDEINEVLARSIEEPVFIFKHSTTCPISAAAFRRIETYIQTHPDVRLAIYMVKVIESREVSDSIARQFRIRHESPQLILFNMKQPVWNASHGGIDARGIDEALAEVMA